MLLTPMDYVLHAEIWVVGVFYDLAVSSVILRYPINILRYYQKARVHAVEFMLAPGLFAAVWCRWLLFNRLILTWWWVWVWWRALGQFMVNGQFSCSAHGVLCISWLITPPSLVFVLSNEMQHKHSGMGEFTNGWTPCQPLVALHPALAHTPV